VKLYREIESLFDMKFGCLFMTDFDLI